MLPCRSISPAARIGVRKLQLRAFGQSCFEKSWSLVDGVDQQQRQARSFSVRSRRKRPNYDPYPQEDYVRTPDAFYMETPYHHGKGATLEEYMEKASLSPWTPLPESAYRKYFDLAEAQPHDIHVDLGCGDGRINFHAVDNVKLERSIGIDVDEEILQRAEERLARRHPKPTNLEFYIADLMDEKDPAWEKIREATIITMFFAQKALKKFQPVLERQLVGSQCKILTAGYAMPKWSSHVSEVVLGTQIHMYKWGYDDDPLGFEDDIIDEEDTEYQGVLPNPLHKQSKFKDYKIVDLDEKRAKMTQKEKFEEMKRQLDDEDDDVVEALPDSGKIWFYSVSVMLSVQPLCSLLCLSDTLWFNLAHFRFLFYER